MAYASGKLVNDTFGTPALTRAVGLGAFQQDGLGDIWETVGTLARKVASVAEGVAGAAPAAKQVASGQSKVAIVPSSGPSTVLPVPGEPYAVATSALPGWVIPAVAIGALYLLLRRR
jgi:hypothetical protein